MPKSPTQHRGHFFESLEDRINLACMPSMLEIPSSAEAVEEPSGEPTVALESHTQNCASANNQESSSVNSGRNSGTEITLEMIDFNGLPAADESAVSFDTCWGCLGIDRHGLIYMGVGNQNGKGPDDQADVSILTYDTRTGEKTYLGSLLQTTDAQGNSAANETISKVHVTITEHNGKMYFGTHDYEVRDALTNHRGGHYYSIDIDTKEITDLSKTDPEGISIKYESFIAFDILRDENKLAGLTFPNGHYVVYDLNKETNNSTIYDPLPGGQTNNVPREIIAANGSIYSTYGQGGQQSLWKLDLSAAPPTYTELPASLMSGHVQGLVTAKDGESVYLLDFEGYYYRFDTGTETLTNLGNFLPEDELTDRELGVVHAMSMNHDETMLYTMPYLMKSTSPDSPNIIEGQLYEFNIETGEKQRLADFSDQLGAITTNTGFTTGNGLVDADGNIYFGWFHNDAAGAFRLLKISGIETSKPASKQDPLLPGDVNSDGRVDVTDIDAIRAYLNSDAPQYDFTADGVVDESDVDYLVEHVLNTRPGDANLDGRVNFDDFVVVALNFGESVSSWELGDFDLDGQVSFDDFIKLSQNFGFSEQQPEPAPVAF